MRKSVSECSTNRAPARFESATRGRARRAFADREGKAPGRTGGTSAVRLTGYDTEHCGVLPIFRNFWRPNALLFNLAFLKDSN